MEDLTGLEWTSSTFPPAPKAPVLSSAYSNFRPSPPTSGKSTPLNDRPSRTPSKAEAGTADSFSGLVGFASTKSNSSITLQERRRALLDEKGRQEKHDTQQNVAPFGVGDNIWDQLASGRSTPALPAAAQREKNLAKAPLLERSEEFDTHTGPSNTRLQSLPSTGAPAKHISHSTAPRASAVSEDVRSGFADDEDDDPFGLNQLTTRANFTTNSSGPVSSNDDDVLGLLGQPVSNAPKSKPSRGNPIPTSPQNGDETEDRAIAELIDMGFTAENARQALDHTESKHDVPNAVTWLLNRAHAEARQEMNSRRRSNEFARKDNERIVPGRSRRQPSIDEARASGPPSLGRHEAFKNGEVNSNKDAAQIAAEFGNNFLKTAGNLWKTGTKRVQQAVQEFNSDSDSSQPRWMKEASDRSRDSSIRRSPEPPKMTSGEFPSGQGSNTGTVTDEARMLESDHGRPQPRKIVRARQESRLDSSGDNSRDHSPAIPSRLRDSMSVQGLPSRQEHQQLPPLQSHRAKLSRQAIDEQASQAYVSSARRRTPAVKAPAAASEPDLLESVAPRPVPIRPSTTQPARTTKPSISNEIRPPPSSRSIPNVSGIAVKAANSHREAGTEHFKRGDYATSHQSYSTALSLLPETHPIIIILLTNRATTAMKIGEPKTAIIDTDAALSIIGPSRGESETIDLGNGEAPKPMRDYYGKALMRKAEALEQMEKWSEAAAVWKAAVEGGHGGTTAVQGRLRAEKAVNPRPQTAPKLPSTAKKMAPAPKRPGTTTSSTNPPSSAAAVSRLRAANLAAERADDEKFALSDSVDARVTAWKGGKADNLRALLGSLDTVLWHDAGWKKVGMAELVMPGKVKVVYLKGIGMVHPDKIPTNATTEQRMIAGAVFSTLNEAWDKFKAENRL